MSKSRPKRPVLPSKAIVKVLITKDRNGFVHAETTYEDGQVTNTTYFLPGTGTGGQDSGVRIYPMPEAPKSPGAANEQNKENNKVINSLVKNAVEEMQAGMDMAAPGSKDETVVAVFRADGMIFRDGKWMPEDQDYGPSAVEQASDTLMAMAMAFNQGPGEALRNLSVALQDLKLEERDAQPAKADRADPARPTRNAQPDLARLAQRQQAIQARINNLWENEPAEEPKVPDEKLTTQQKNIAAIAKNLSFPAQPPAPKPLINQQIDYELQDGFIPKSGGSSYLLRSIRESDDKFAMLESLKSYVLDVSGRFCLYRDDGSKITPNQVRTMDALAFLRYLKFSGAELGQNSIDNQPVPVDPSDWVPITRPEIEPLPNGSIAKALIEMASKEQPAAKPPKKKTSFDAIELD